MTTTSTNTDYTVTEAHIETFGNAIGSTKDTVNGKRGADIKRSKAAIQNDDYKSFTELKQWEEKNNSKIKLSGVIC